MRWNVKNEMPTGSNISRNGSFVLQPEHLREFIRRANKEVEVFENTEQPEMQRYCDPEDEALPGAIGGRRYQVSGREAEHRAGDQQKTEAPVPLGVEIVAGRGRGPPFWPQSGCQASPSPPRRQ